jgi:hypothetical protein
MINAVARETPKPPPNVSGERTPIGTIQPIALGPGKPGPLPTGPRRPPSVQRFPALPEKASGGVLLPSETVKPMVKPRLTVEQKVKERLPEREPVKAMTPPERRAAPRLADVTGPDVMKTMKMNNLRDEIAKLPEGDPQRVDMEHLLADMKAHPEESAATVLGGKDINTMRAEGVLPGMEGAVAKQAEGAARVKGEELTAEMNKPRNVDEAAGHLETRGELFRGKGPQGELLKPMEKPTITEPEEEEAPYDKLIREAKESRELAAKRTGPLARGHIEHAEELERQAAKIKPEEEAEPAEIKGVTEPIKAAKEKFVPVEKRYPEEKIKEAEAFIRENIEKMGATGEKPGHYPIIESREGNQNPNWQEIVGWRGSKSMRDTLPWMKENPKFNPEALDKALHNRDSALRQRAVESAIKFLDRQKMTPEERAAAGETIAEKWKGFRPQPSKFLKTD